MKSSSSCSQPSPAGQRCPKPTAATKGRAESRSRTHAIATDPSLQGRRAAAWVSMWDKASRTTRCHMLEAFLELHSRSNAAAVAQDLGDAAPLFFTRVTSWLRLSYCTLLQPTAKPSVPPANAATAAAPQRASLTNEAGAITSAPSSALLLQLGCILVFLRGPGYATQLVESGVTATLIDCLERGASASGAATFQPLTKEERTHLLLVLLYVANAGRVYREFISEEDGLVSLLRVMRAEKDDAIANLLSDLLVALGKGNPRLAPLVERGLFRFLVSHYRRGASSGEVKDADVATPTLATVAGDSNDDDDTVVVLYAARTLRALQSFNEIHHCGGSLVQRPSPPQRRSVSDFVDDYEGRTNNAGVPELDLVPVVCCRVDCVASSSAAAREELALGGVAAHAVHPLLQPITTQQFLDALFGLTLDDDTRFRVEGSELLVMVAKNVELMPRILNRALDVLDDDMLVIADADDAATVARRQRRQLSCGRVAVQVMLTLPRTAYRHRAIIRLIALRSAHMSLVKYLRLTDLGDAAAVVDCCLALQLVARAADAEQRSRLQQQETISARTGAAGAANSAMVRMGQVIRDAVGTSLYQVLLHEELTVEESFAMLRAARSSATTTAIAG